MDITQALRYALDGETILFLGAGFSIGGINKSGNNLPTARELSYELCKELNIPLLDELAIVSDRFIDDAQLGRGISGLIEFLKRQLICVKTTDIQDVIANVPWLRVYTTNYDNVFELVSKKVKKERETITATVSKKIVSNLKGAIIHMNGSIQSVDTKNFYDEFKITNESYLKSGFLESPWGDQFVHDINNCKAIIFVGYSLKYDLELQKVMHNKICDKAVFIDRKDTDETQKYLFEKWGSFYPIEVQGLAEKIKNVQTEYEPVGKEYSLRGVEEIVITNYKNTRITPNDALNLLVYGKYDKYDFRNPTVFYLRREKLYKEIKEMLHTKKICLIHSNLGNGKSLLLHYIASEFVEENNVYFLKDTLTIEDDLAIIKSRKTVKNIILVDDYDLHMELFKELSYDLPDNVKVIATCRTSICDLLLDRLMNEYKIEAECIGVKNIEIISDDERRELINLLDTYNFWGTNATLSFSEKNSLLNKKYQNRISSIFYMLLDSNVISEKLNVLFRDIDNKEVNRYLLAQSICNICNFKLKGFEIAKLSDIDFSEIEKASISSEYKEIFLRTSNDIELRSTIFSQYFIRNFQEYDDIVHLLQNIYINSLNSFNKEYEIVRKKLISRSNLIEIFGGRKKNNQWKQRDKDIYEFYSSIQQFSKTNPFFWLQFGITALNLKYYMDSKIYFENAYSYATELENFDCFQLDTHYARFLLTEIMDYDMEFDFEKLTKAHRLLMDNSNAEIRLSYVLRQVGIYYAIDKKYEDKFLAQDRLIFVGQINEIVERFEEYFSAIERKKRNNFYFAVDKPVRGAYKQFRKLLMKTITKSKLAELDYRYNRLVKKHDRI